MLFLFPNEMLTLFKVKFLCHFQTGIMTIADKISKEMDDL
jgi:hypothetical protein